MGSTTVFLFSCLFILYKTEAAQTRNSNSTTVSPDVTTPSEKDTDSSKKDVVKAEVEHVSDDAYLDNLSRNCKSSKDIPTCVQYRAMKFIHGMTSPYDDLGFRRSFKFTEFSLVGPVKLVALPPQEIPTNGGSLFEESKPRSTDNEFMKIFRFSLREVERFVRSYAFTVDLSKTGANDVSSPRFIDDDFFSGTLKQVVGRDKKKTLMFLLPLISFFHLKALLVPILLAVLFIKKLLVLGIIFLPSLLSLVKLCKPMHHHHVPWLPEQEPDYHSEYVPHYDAYKSSHGGHGKRPVKHGERHGSTPERNTWNSPAPPPHQPSTNQVWGESNQNPPISYVQQSSGGGVTSNSRIDDSNDPPTRQRSSWNYGNKMAWEQAQDDEVGRGWNRVPYSWNRDKSDSREVKWDNEPHADSELENIKNFLSNFATNGHTNINQLIKATNEDNYSESAMNAHNYYHEKYETTAESKRKKEKCDDDDHKESKKDSIPPMPEIRGNYSDYKTYMSS